MSPLFELCVWGVCTLTLTLILITVLPHQGLPDMQAQQLSQSLAAMVGSQVEEQGCHWQHLQRLNSRAGEEYRALAARLQDWMPLLEVGNTRLTHKQTAWSQLVCKEVHALQRLCILQMMSDAWKNGLDRQRACRHVACCPSFA